MYIYNIKLTHTYISLCALYDSNFLLTSLLFIIFLRFALVISLITIDIYLFAQLILSLLNRLGL